MWFYGENSLQLRKNHHHYNLPETSFSNFIASNDIINKLCKGYKFLRCLKCFHFVPSFPFISSRKPCNQKPHNLELASTELDSSKRKKTKRRGSSRAVRSRPELIRAEIYHKNHVIWLIMVSNVRCYCYSIQYS